MRHASLCALGVALLGAAVAPRVMAQSPATRAPKSTAAVPCAPRSASAVPRAAGSATRIPRALIDRAPSVAVTHHRGTFGGATFDYTATVEEHILTGPDSVPNASLVTISYERDGVADPDRRPVLFAFNGGPGSSSSMLHMNGIGPRLATADGTVENPQSILDVTDLVFIDPVGTGFSRPYTTEAGRRYYWNHEGDAESVARAIEHWLAVHHRERSPRYLAGESYGTVRAGLIIEARPTLRWSGVFLVGVAGLIENAGHEMPFVAALPTMAVSALYHGVIDSAGRSVPQLFDEAVAFARTDYLVALARGASLSAGERDRIAERLSQLTGLPAAYLIEKRLRPSSDDWMLNVLKSRDLRTGLLDTRVTAKRDTTRTGGLNDPAFDGGTHRIGTLMRAPAIVPGSAQSRRARPDTTAAPSALETYLRRDLGFATLESYRSLNLDINPLWNFEHHTGSFEALAAAARADTAMRVLWAGGYYDLTTPVFGAQYIMDEVGMPPDRTTGMILPGAHSVFADSANRRVLAARLRQWVR